MKKQFEILRAYRNAIVHTIDDLDLEQLQMIPKGFKNSIFWNVAHILVIQQVLQYKLSGLDILITNDWVENYKKGTQPKFLINDDEVEYVKRKLISTVDQLEQDYADRKFETYTEYETSMGVTLSSVEDAIEYDNAHEGLHLGVIKVMKKIIIQA